MKDVAEKAGVSITTVSHVINKSRFVSEESVKKVNDAVKELGYRPNIIAQSLRKKKTFTIGIVFSTNINPYFSELIELIEEQCNLQNYNVFLCPTIKDFNKEIDFLNVLVQRGVDGIILDTIICNEKQAQDVLNTIDKPIVIFNREIKGVDRDYVLVDDLTGGYLATKYLLELGHKRIASVMGEGPAGHAANKRMLGYRKAFREAGLNINYDDIYKSKHNCNDGYKTMKMIYESKNMPDSIFFHSDLMAIGAISACFDLGLKVPDDISIIGYDDIIITEYTTPRLTTVAPPKKDLAEKIVNTLLNRINDEDSRPGKIILTPQLILRDSCKRKKI